MNGGSATPSISGSKSVLYPDQITFSEKRSSTGCQRCLMVLTLLLFCATAVFLSLFLIYYFKYEDREKSQACNSPDCVKTAAAIAEMMDPAVDPCEDFAQFACGNFYKTAVIKTGKTRISVFNILSDKNLELKKAVLSEEGSGKEWKYMTNMKNYYKACLNEEKIEEIGLQPYLNSEEAKVWPTLLGASWSDEASFNLNDVIAKYEALYVEPLFSYYVSSDFMDSSRNTLFIGDPALGLSKEYLSRERNDSVIMAYETYLKDFSIALNADPVVAAQDATDIVDFEIAMAKIVVPKEERRDILKMYNPTTLGQLAVNYSYIDIPRGIRAAFSTANIQLSSDQEVIVPFPSYYEQLEGVLQNVTPRTLQNLFSIKYALTRVSRLTKRLRELGLKFDKVYSGKTEERARWKTCVDSATGLFSLGMGKEYTRRKFSENAKTYMNEMIDNLKVAFKSQVESVNWMSATTKTEAYEKLAKIGRKIGYPDVDFDNEHIEEKYENLTMKPDNMYDNREVSRIERNVKGLRKLLKPVDKNEWHMATFDVNAYYSSTSNEVVFPAGILQPPFFSEKFYDSINYGAIGVVIGHEITHGFDDGGSQFDKDGNLRNWWQPEDQSNFKQRKQCIIDQYSAYKVESVDKNVNGINTQGENVADNGGIRQSFSAYKEAIGRKGEPKPLPGLGLSDKQLFFLGYAQLWCDKMTDASIIQKIELDPHSPGRFRIHGPLQNFPEFAEAYKCPVGSPMNPEKKCTVW